MTIMDMERLEAVDTNAVRQQKPYPYLPAKALITDEGYARLRKSLPPRERFSGVFGKRRPHGQAHHDRYVLQYKPWETYSESWDEFISELKGDTYRQFIARLLGHDKFMLHFHWHYTPKGCSVSPHCDAPWKFGSHIFYLNTEEDWDPSWGGETLILDDEGKYKSRSAPKFEDFDKQIAAPSLGNNSLLFLRGDHSWHGVHPIRCPDDKLRKVFIVEFRHSNPIMAFRTRLGF